MLTRTALNRALLARQHLLARTTEPVPAVVAHLIGLQAQNPWSPYVGLWSRRAGFVHDEIGSALVERTATRIAVMRGTIHLVTAADTLLLHGLTAPLYGKDLRVNATHAAPLRSVHVPDVTAAARALVEGEPLATTELGRRLAERWPDLPAATLAYAARNTLPMVQVPPRGVWGRSGATTWTTAWSWLDDTYAAACPDLTDPAVYAVELERLVLRYLAAFGPASVADAQTWSGLTGLRPVFERLRDRLVRFVAAPEPEDDRPASARTPRRRPGRELFDLPDAPRPDPDEPAPVRFLPDYDNLLLGHADRSRVIDDAARQRLRSPNGVVPPTVLVDGRVGATWSVSRERLAPPGSRPRRELATLTVHPFTRLDPSVRREVETEGEAFVQFMADDAAEHRVVVAPA